MFSVSRFLNKHEYFYLFLLALLTAIAGEIRIIPFNGEFIRFGLGGVIFLLFILIRPPISVILGGIVTGIIVVCFRVISDFLFNRAPVFISLTDHLPAAIFYVLFAIGLSMIDIEKYKQIPLLFGAFAAGIEFVGNSVEHFIRVMLLDGMSFGFREWAILCAVAILRGYFVIGIYSSIVISEQKKQVQEKLGVGSELYAETLYLEKSMNHIEQITASSHDLYRKLKKQNLDDFSVQALNIAQEVHEIKKDSQRIYSGLSKITRRRMDDVFHLSEVLNFVISANKKYSELLKKEIIFRLSLAMDFETDQHIPLLAILNNITANAVESIAGSGKISFEIFEKSGYTFIRIKDSGEGIPEDEVNIIFEPGFTTKFSEQGVAATGIGLSHVKDIIQTLEGGIKVVTSDTGTDFQIQIPTGSIRG